MIRPKHLLSAFVVLVVVLSFQNCSSPFSINPMDENSIAASTDDNKLPIDDITDNDTDTDTDPGNDPDDIEPLPKEQVPSNVKLMRNTYRKVGGRGDNWTLTWADDGTRDGSVLVSMDDGYWDGDLGPATDGMGFNHAIYKINGGGDNFSMQNVSRIKSFPFYPFFTYCHFGYGILAVKGVWYSLVSQCGERFYKKQLSRLLWGQFFGLKMLKSSNQGASWSVVQRDGSTSTNMKKINTECKNDKSYFFCKDNGITIRGRDRKSQYYDQTYYSFVMSAFVQAGKDYADRSDEYVYIYSPRPNSDKTFNLELARAPIDGIEKRDRWQFFKNYNSQGKPVWSSSISSRGPVLKFSKYDKGQNWYSYLPDVTYNKGLGVYIMVTGAINNSRFNAGGTDIDGGSGSLFFYHSKKPYGPWSSLKVENKNFMKNFSAISNDKTYQPKLDPKRISADGKKMFLIWSNFGGNFSDAHYSWHEMQFEIELEDAL